MYIEHAGVDHQLVKPKKTVMQGLPRVNTYSNLKILVFSPRNLKRKYAILFFNNIFYEILGHKDVFSHCLPRYFKRVLYNFMIYKFQFYFPIGSNLLLVVSYLSSVVTSLKHTSEGSIKNFCNLLFNRPKLSDKQKTICIYLHCISSAQEMQVQSLGWEDSLDEENGNVLQYSCLGNPMDRGAWWVTAHGIIKVRHDLVTKQ